MDFVTLVGLLASIATIASFFLQIRSGGPALNNARHEPPSAAPDAVSTPVQYPPQRPVPISSAEAIRTHKEARRQGDHLTDGEIINNYLVARRGSALMAGAAIAAAIFLGWTGFLGTAHVVILFLMCLYAVLSFQRPYRQLRNRFDRP